MAGFAIGQSVSSSAGSRVYGENLALQYQNLITGIVRIQAGRERIADFDSFRRRMKAAFEEVERNAGVLNYDFHDIQVTHLAVVAFLDEAVLASSDPCRAQWSRLPLAQELLGQPTAGDVFFDRLEGLLRSRKDSAQLADILEVFLLCLLLGFEGRYSGLRRGELHSFIERTRVRIEATRPPSGRLLPAAELEVVPPAREAPRRKQDRYRLAALVTVIGVVFLFLVFKLDLFLRSSKIQALEGVS